MSVHLEDLEVHRNCPPEHCAGRKALDTIAARDREIEILRGAIETGNRLASALESRSAQLEGALQRVEWVETEYDGRTYYICPWCDSQGDEHKEGCMREAVLANQAPASKPDLEGLRERIQGTVSYIRLRMNDRETIDATTTDAILDVLRKEGLLP